MTPKKKTHVEHSERSKTTQCATHRRTVERNRRKKKHDINWTVYLTVHWHSAFKINFFHYLIWMSMMQWNMRAPLTMHENGIGDYIVMYSFFSYIPFSFEIVCALCVCFFFLLHCCCCSWYFFSFLYLTSFIGSFAFWSLAMQCIHCNALDRCLLRRSRLVIIIVAHLLFSLFSCGLFFNCNNESINSSSRSCSRKSSDSDSDSSNIDVDICRYSC